MSDCIFCKIANKQVPAELVHEDELAVAFWDINPQAPTHILIVPKKHIASLAEAGEEDTALLGHLHKVAREKAASLKLASFRLVINNGREAGQSVDHIHYHLLGGRPMGWPPG